MSARSVHLTRQGIPSFRDISPNSMPYFRTLLPFGNVYSFRYTLEAISAIR